MPNLEEHCRHTLRRYGVEGRDIHQWLDEPARRYASGHRQFRHDSETIKLVGEIFGEKYGAQSAENIALDHILTDHQEEIKRRNEEKQEIYRGPTEEEIREFYSQPIQATPPLIRKYVAMKKELGGYSRESLLPCSSMTTKVNY